MRWPDKLGLKIYCFIFAWIALGQMLALTLPQVDSFIYYHTMIAFHKPSAVHYVAALAAASLTMASLIPLIRYAFNAPRRSLWIFRTLFILRIIADLTGHNFEMQFLKAALHDTPVAAVASLALTLAILFPSYQAHFRYAFKK